MPDLRIELKRASYQQDRTLGWLSVWAGPVQVFRCACLELPWRNNEAQVSCVPAGTYRVILEHSAAFKMALYELKGVPGRSEVKIHGANFPSELRGCIAPALIHADINGDGRLDAKSSRVARQRLHAALDGVTETTITIVGDGRDVLQ